MSNIREAKYAEDTWDYEESLEEALSIISPYDISINILCEDKDRDKNYRPGDILMVPNWSSGRTGHQNSPHRILVITSSTDGEYSGYILSSKIEKANKYNSKFPNNIYIQDYDTILDIGRKIGSKEVFIRVDDLVSFKASDLSDWGTWKGRVNSKFFDFVEQCRKNYLLDKNMNREITWETKEG